MLTTASPYSLTPHNTFGIACTCNEFVIAEHESEWPDIVQKSLSHPQPLLVLGEGSNVLFGEHYEGVVAQHGPGKIEIHDVDDTTVEVVVGAGANWHGLVQHAVVNKLGGIENLALIPGSVGAAPVQNIGAYGVEFRDVVVSVHGYDMRTKTFRTLSADECEFGYRDSIFKRELAGLFVITEVKIRLQKHSSPNISYGALKAQIQSLHPDKPVDIAAVYDAVCAVRISKLPVPSLVGNAGSFFKNPVVALLELQELQQRYQDVPHFGVSETHVKIPAGWLIDQAGWKAYRKGDAGVWPHQALVLVNYGNASGRDIHELALEIERDVLQKFGIQLEREVRNMTGY